MTSIAQPPLQEGDNVSWKWGSSTPQGTIAAIQTTGQLEIESKGKLVHKNADPANPAVHVAREPGNGNGNDVVKRASELTRLGGEEGVEVGEGGEGKGEGEGEGEAKSQPTPKKRAPRKKSSAVALTGEKRQHEDGDPTSPTASGEKPEPSKKPKKAKVKLSEPEHGAGGTSTEAGDHPLEGGTKKRGPGRPRKGSKTKKAGVEGGVDKGEGGAAVKKRGPGRPRKVDGGEHLGEHLVGVEVGAGKEEQVGGEVGEAGEGVRVGGEGEVGGEEGDAVAARTRSKDD